MRISVRATAPGTYANRYINRGEVFVIEENMFSKNWMEKLEAPAMSHKREEERRSEERDLGEVEQHKAEKKGWA